MKTWTRWVIAALLVALLAWAAVSALSARKARQQAAAATSSQPVIELASTDVVLARTLELGLGLPISGSLKAVNSAMVKARVAGELQGLTVREGDFVKAGQMLARINPGEYQSRTRQLQEQAGSARAQMEIAQRQYDNNQALVNQGFISRNALDTSLGNLNAAKATHQAALAAADVARRALDDTVLRAPLAGQVAQRFVQPGERVGVDTRVLEIVDLSRLELEASLSAAEALAVQPGQRAELQVEGSNQTIPATVARINPSAQAGSRSVLAYLNIESPPRAANPANAAASTDAPTPALRQGIFVRGTLGTSRVSVLAVPLAAVRTDQPAPYVQTVENDKVVHRPVQMGVRGESMRPAGASDPTQGLSASNGGNETLVAVQGITENAVVIRGAVGPLQAGTAVRFTGGAKPGNAAQPAASSTPAAAAAPATPRTAP